MIFPTFHLSYFAHMAQTFISTGHNKAHRASHLPWLATNIAIALIALPCALASCGEDRSGEQPFAPTVVTRSVEVVADSAILTGQVTESPNSSLTQCGFCYGNDTLKVTATASEATESFSIVTQALGEGDYYAVAFAENGVGTSYGDTLRFSIGD